MRNFTSCLLAFFTVFLLFPAKGKAQVFQLLPADITTIANGSAASILKQNAIVKIQQIGVTGTSGSYVELNNSNPTPVLNAPGSDAITIESLGDITSLTLKYSSNGAATTTNPYVGYSPTISSMGSATVAISSCQMTAGILGTTQTTVVYTVPAGTRFIILARGKACDATAANTISCRVSQIDVGYNAGTPPSVTTTSAAATGGSTGTATGNISDGGTTAVSASGFCYGTSLNPTLSDGVASTLPVTTSGSFTLPISGLSAGTLYHVRAYATNGAGTVYGSDQTFTTNAVPTLNVNPATLAFGEVYQNTSSEKTYTISGGFLTGAPGNIAINAPSGFEVSLTSGTGFGSSVNVPYSSATLASTVIYVRFSPTGVAAYNGGILNAGGGDSKSVTVSGMGVLNKTGDYMSKASTGWDLPATWNKWDGAAWVASGDFPNSSTASVTIDGFNVTGSSSSKSCANLTLQNGGTYKTANTVKLPFYIKVYGTTVLVNSGCQMGSSDANQGDAADGLSIDYIGTGSKPTLTIAGGGAINVSRLRTNTAGTTIIVNTNMSLNYHGGSNFGNAASFYTVAGDGNTLTVNAGKTLTFAPWAAYSDIASSHTSGTFSQTFNIDGTLTFMPGNPVPDTVAASRVGWHSSGYMSLGIVAGKFINLNVGSTGTVNVTELYPNGTLANNNPGVGIVTGIDIAAGGILNVTGVADLRNPGQTITGGGTFNLGTIANLRIGSDNGISASDATGSIQTAIRVFPTTADYLYEGANGQQTGNGLPGTVASLTIDNSAGVALSGSVTAVDSLKLIDGNLLTGPYTITTKTVIGGTASSYVVTDGSGTLKINNVGASPVTFPVGPTTTLYNPAIIANSGTPDNFAVGTSTVAPNYIGGTGPSVNAAWYISEAVAGGSNATITTQWNASQEPAGFTSNKNQAFLFHSDGYGATGTVTPQDITGLYTITASGFTEFSPFGVGSSPSILPIVLAYFKGNKVNAGNALSWSVNCTSARISMEIERSADGRKFGSIATINADRVRCAQPFDLVDTHPLKGTNYYRLKMIDVDGKLSYSAVIAIINGDKGFEIVGLYPTIVNSSAFLSISTSKSGKIQTVITDLSGRTIRSATVTVNAGSNLVPVESNTLAAGAYQLTIYADGVLAGTVRFVKQ
ncbi:MAG: hypothetical protein ABIX01_03905 [Chitinophagaceae bacterium]